MAENKRPMLDELKKGKWPSFVKEIEREEENASVHDLLNLLETSYEDNTVHWKHGGIVGVTGYGGGVIGRYTDLPEQYPNVTEFHTMRINQPSGWFYSSETLRSLCDIWEKYGSGLTNMHGATGDAILLGTTTDNLQPAFNELSNHGFDLGGSGSNLRTPSCCAGMARCQNACIDAMDICHDLTNEFQDYLHRPMWPYKSKIKISGCANDCVSSIARSDISIIGTWRDTIRIDQEAMNEYGKGTYDIKTLVVDKCPTKCISYNEETYEFKIDDENCVRCMHCINKLPKALRVGKDQGATILIGSKATIVQSAFLSWVIVPFMKMNKEDGYAEFKEFIEKVWDWWDEHAKVRERIGELIYRVGMRKFLNDVGIEPVPQMVNHPRANPYFFWDAEELVEGAYAGVQREVAADSEVK